MLSVLHSCLCVNLSHIPGLAWVFIFINNRRTVKKKWYSCKSLNSTWNQKPFSVKRHNMWSPDCNHKFYGSAKLDCQCSVKPLREMDELKLLDAFSSASMSLKCYDRHPNLKTEIICECQRTTPFFQYTQCSQPLQNSPSWKHFTTATFLPLWVWWNWTQESGNSLLCCFFLNQGFCSH